MKHHPKQKAECLIAWLKDRKVPTGLTRQKKKAIEDTEAHLDRLLARFRN